MLLPCGRLFFSPTLQTWSIGISLWLPCDDSRNGKWDSPRLHSNQAVFLCYGRSMHRVPGQAEEWPVGCPAACLDSALARQSSEKSQERSSTAGDFHHLLLHMDFFHSAECHHSPWVSQKLGEWARKELYQDVCSPVGLGWCAGGFVGRESCPRQLLVRLTVSKRCCWGLTDGNDCAIGADSSIFNL